MKQSLNKNLLTAGLMALAAATISSCGFPGSVSHVSNTAESSIGREDGKYEIRLNNFLDKEVHVSRSEDGTAYNVERSIWYASDVTALQDGEDVFKIHVDFDTAGMYSFVPYLKSDFFVAGKKGDYWAINFEGCAEESDDCRMNWRLYDRKGRETESFRLGGAPFEGFEGMYATDDNRFVQRNKMFDVRKGSWEFLPGCGAEKASGDLYFDSVYCIWEDDGGEGRVMVFTFPELKWVNTFSCKCMDAGLGFSLWAEEDASKHRIVLHDFNQEDEWVIDPDHPEAVMKRTVKSQ